MDKLEKVIKGLEQFIADFKPFCGNKADWQRVDDALALLKAQEPVTGETSDGYHTFNELYHHRAVLFSVIVANYPDKAWKSKKHHDGTMYDNMFIVGIETPDGQATYHYDIDPYWDMFKCRVLDNAPEWDGHTPAQAIERIGKLKAQEPRVMTLEEVDAVQVVRCKDCGYFQANNAEEGDWSGRCTNVYVPMNGTTVDGWWFCADGERRNDDGNDYNTPTD